jgi:hypothetical protein
VVVILTTTYYIIGWQKSKILSGRGKGLMALFSSIPGRKCGFWPGAVFVGPGIDFPIGTMYNKMSNVSWRIIPQGLKAWSLCA